MLFCKNSFATKYNLQRQILKHTREKSYQCKICDQSFGRSDVLKRHIESHSSEYNLQRHTLKHTGGSHTKAKSVINHLV